MVCPIRQSELRSWCVRLDRGRLHRAARCCCHWHPRDRKDRCPRRSFLLVVADTGILVTDKTAAPDVLRSPALANLIPLAAIRVHFILAFAPNRWRKSRLSR